jgi:hypothetical protein
VFLRCILGLFSCNDDLDVYPDPFSKGEPLHEIAKTVYNWMRGHGNSPRSMIEIQDIIGEKRLLALAKKHRWK